MTENNITISTYYWALAEAAALRDHRLNSVDKTVWWRVTHQLLTRHSPTSDRPDVCTGCDEAWPCWPDPEN